MNQSMVPLFGFGQGQTGGTLTVTAPAGVTVTITKDGISRIAAAGSDGTAVFRGLKSGEWTVTIQSGDQTATDTVQIQADFTVTMAFPQSA